MSTGTLSLDDILKLQAERARPDRSALQSEHDRLAASNKELVEALKEIENCGTPLADAGKRSPWQNGYYAAMDEVANLARAAIAKARGEGT